jgi:hypothetical protein
MVPGFKEVACFAHASASPFRFLLIWKRETLSNCDKTYLILETMPCSLFPPGFNWVITALMISSESPKKDKVLIPCSFAMRSPHHSE